MSTDAEKKGKAAPRRRPSEGQRIVLVLSVIGTTVFIVAVWAMLLPSMLATPQLFTPEEVDRWHLIQDTQREGSRSFQEALDDLGAQLETLDRDVEFVRETAPKAPVLGQEEIERLRARIEAAASVNHANDDAP